MGTDLRIESLIAIEELDSFLKHLSRAIGMHCAIVRFPTESERQILAKYEKNLRDNT